MAAASNDMSQEFEDMLGELEVLFSLIFVLLKNVGLIEIDVNVDVNLIADSFDYYTV